MAAKSKPADGSLGRIVRPQLKNNEIVVGWARRDIKAGEVFVFKIGARSSNQIVLSDEYVRLVLNGQITH